VDFSPLLPFSNEHILSLYLPSLLSKLQVWKPNRSPVSSSHVLRRYSCAVSSLDGTSGAGSSFQRCVELGHTNTPAAKGPPTHAELM